METEVGPIKYVAELIYGGDSQNYLDQAVRLFILMLVFVFDPLAVVLVIAANQTLLRYGINLEKGGPENAGSIDNLDYGNISSSENSRMEGTTSNREESTDTQTSSQRDSDEDVSVRSTRKDSESGDTESESQPTSVEYFDRDEMPSAVDDAAQAMAEAALNNKIKELENQLEEKPKEVIVEKIIEKEKDINLDLTPPQAILDLEKKLQKRLDKDDK